MVFDHESQPNQPTQNRHRILERLIRSRGARTFFNLSFAGLTALLPVGEIYSKGNTDVRDGELPTETPVSPDSEASSGFIKQGTNIRSDAGRDADILQTTTTAARFDLTGETKTVDSETWVEIKIDDSTLGWVLATLVFEIEIPETVPTPPTTKTPSFTPTRRPVPTLRATPTAIVTPSPTITTGASARVSSTPIAKIETESSLPTESAEIFPAEELTYQEVLVKFPNAAKSLMLGTRLFNQFLQEDARLPEHLNLADIDTPPAEISAIEFTKRGPILWATIGDKAFFWGDEKHDDSQYDAWFWDQGFGPFLNIGFSTAYNPNTPNYPKGSGLNSDPAIASSIAETYNTFLTKEEVQAAFIGIVENTPDNFRKYAAENLEWVLESAAGANYPSMLEWVENTGKQEELYASAVDTASRMKLFTEYIHVVFPEIKQIIFMNVRLLSSPKNYVDNKSGENNIGLQPEESFLFDEVTGVLYVFGAQAHANSTVVLSAVSEAVTEAAQDYGHVFPESDLPESSTSMVTGAQEHTLLASAKLVPGEIDGEKGIFDAMIVAYAQEE